MATRQRRPAISTPKTIIMNWQKACSESEALRRLNLPDSRRVWLRNRLQSVPVGGLIVYELDAVTKLSVELEGSRESTVRGEGSAVLNKPTGSALFTR
jgi:hypothetical protein